MGDSGEANANDLRGVEKRKWKLTWKRIKKKNTVSERHKRETYLLPAPKFSPFMLHFLWPCASNMCYAAFAIYLKSIL